MKYEMNYTFLIILTIKMKKAYLYDVIKPNIDIKIIGPSDCGKTKLTTNILAILNKKYFIDAKLVYLGVHNNNRAIATIHAYTLYNEIFHIVEYSSDYEPKSILEPPGHISFIHSNLLNKQQLLKKYNNLLSDDEINYSSQYAFFVTSLAEPLQLCETEIETSYLTKYNENPFCYNNVRNLIFNIKNNYSLYHNENGELYEKLHLRLKELEDKICNIKLCMKHGNDNLWLPSELNLVIINMFIYL